MNSISAYTIRVVFIISEGVAEHLKAAPLGNKEDVLIIFHWLLPRSYIISWH
jgi:hypothetical protein